MQLVKMKEQIGVINDINGPILLTVFVMISSFLLDIFTN